MADDRGVTAKLDQLAELMMSEFSAMKAEIAEVRADLKALDDRMRGLEIAVAETRGRIAERSAMLQLVVASEISAA